MPMNPIFEAAALRQTEDALNDFVRVAIKIGLSKESLALMLRAVADELSPPIMSDSTDLLQ